MSAVAAATLITGSVTLLLNGFYRPFFHRAGDDREDVAFVAVGYPLAIMTVVHLQRRRREPQAPAVSAAAREEAR